jgi:hypothetical protein
MKKIFRFMAFTALAALLFAACKSPADPPPVVLTRITVTPKEKIIIVAEEFQLTAVKTPADAADAIEWVSSDPAKVTITGSGKIKGIGVTTTPVTITVKSKTNAAVLDTCMVTVAAEHKDLTGIAIYPSTRSISVNEEFQLTAERTPTDGTDDIEWVSSDPAKVTVTGTGKIKGIAATTTPVTVTIKSQKNAEVFGTCEVIVTSEAPTYELKLIHNATDTGTYDGSDATISIPSLVENRYVINSYFGESGGTAPTGNFNTSGGFVNTTFFYVDHLFEGDFKISARVKFTKMPPTNSTSKSIVIGGIAPVSDTPTIPGTLSNVGGIHFRTSGGSGGTPYAVRSVASKQTEQASVAGLSKTVGKEDEYIFEVSRTAAGYTTSFNVGKTGDLVDTAMVNYTDRVVTADTPVFVGFALMAVETEISQIKVWDGNLEGDPVFSTPNSTPRPVPVAGVKIGVPSGMTTSGAGTALEPQQLIVRLGDVQTNGIQLSPIVTPSYADELGVDYYLAQNFTNATTIAVNETTGLVSVTGAGIATIQMISRDTAEPEAYLTITVTPDYVPVGDFTISAEKNSIVVSIEEITLSTDIPATVTDPVIVWTSSDTDTVTFIDSENAEVSTITGPTAKIKGLKAGNSTITATATTTNEGTPTQKSAMKTITVTASGGGTDKFWNFSDATFQTLPSPITTETVIDGLTLIADSTNTMGYGNNTKSIDGIDFTQRLQLNGSGSPTGRALKFVVTGACTVTIYGITGSNNNNRDIALSDGTTEIGTHTFGGTAIDKATLSYTGEAATLYIYSKNSGINLYGVKVDY